MESSFPQSGQWTKNGATHRNIGFLDSDCGEIEPPFAHRPLKPQTQIARPLKPTPLSRSISTTECRSALLGMALNAAWGFRFL